MVFQTGVLTAKVNGGPQKVNGLAGITLGMYASSSIRHLSDTDCPNSIIQSMSTLIGGAVVSLAYAWKPALVGIGRLLPHQHIAQPLLLLFSSHHPCCLFSRFHPTGESMCASSVPLL